MAHDIAWGDSSLLLGYRSLFYVCQDISRALSVSTGLVIIVLPDIRGWETVP